MSAGLEHPEAERQAVGGPQLPAGSAARGLHGAHARQCSPRLVAEQAAARGAMHRSCKGQSTVPSQELVVGGPQRVGEPQRACVVCSALVPHAGFRVEGATGFRV